MKGLIDTHTHLESFARKGALEGTLTAAADAGVARLVTVGTEPEDWQLYAELAAMYPQIDYTVGIHPCSVAAGWERWAEEIEPRFQGASPPAALGEIGLDRFHLSKDAEEAAAAYELQRRAFEAQLSIAKRIGCPIVVHSRGAFADCVATIDASGADWRKVVFHCFSEGPGEMRQLLDRGGFGSFTGIVTFKNAEAIREAAKLQGLDRLMIETDAPYLAPMPFRGKPNEPAYLVHTAAFCAALFGVAPEEFAARTAERSRDFFGLR